MAERGEEAESDAEAEGEIPVAVNSAHALTPTKGYDTEGLMLKSFGGRSG